MLWQITGITDAIITEITDAADDLGGIWEQEQVLAKLFFSQNNKSHDQTLSLTTDFFFCFPTWSWLVVGKAVSAELQE